MSPTPPLVGMVHLLPLPGSPGFGGSIDQIVAAAIDDATILEGAGFPSVMIENFGDAPFYSDTVPPATVSAMTLVAAEVKRATGLHLGVNVLRNDALSALAIAAVTGAGFIRVNVLTGVMFTDQGPITGNAAELQRARMTLAPQVQVWADVFVKHAVSPAGLDIRQAAADTVERGLADAVIVSGSGTGIMPDLDQARAIASAIPKETPLVIGSGVTVDNLPALFEVADTVIIGSATKHDGHASNRVDSDRAARIATVAADCGLL